MITHYEGKAQVYCRECGCGYEQLKMPGVTWPPWCCGACGADNVHAVLLVGGNVTYSPGLVHPFTCACPWCGLRMDQDGKDPVLERCCGLCETFTLAERKQRNPGMGALHDAALTYDLLEDAWDLDPNPDFTTEADRVGPGGDGDGDRAGDLRSDCVRSAERCDAPRGPTRSGFRPGQVTYSMALLMLSLFVLGFAIAHYRSRQRIVQPPAVRVEPRVVQLSDTTSVDVADDESPTRPYVRRAGYTFFDVEIPYAPYRADKRLPRTSPAAAGALTIDAKPTKDKA